MQILRKLLSSILTLVLVSLMILTVFQILPGNPARSILGVEASDEQVARLERELGLDKPLTERYMEWVGGVSRGDFGTSLKYNTKVETLIRDRFPVTLVLTVYALVLTILIGLPLGVWIAASDGKWYASFFATLTQLGISIPAFWVGFFLIRLFSVRLGWFPTFGSNVMGGGFLHVIHQFFLPAFAVAIGNIAIAVRFLRSTILGELKKEYVRTARMKGLVKREWMMRHVLRNALIPVITVMGIITTSSIGGSIVIENVFALPGLGSLMVQSVSYRDFPLMQSLVLFVAMLVVVINLLVDLTYQLIDPRMRTGD